MACSPTARAPRTSLAPATCLVFRHRSTTSTMLMLVPMSRRRPCSHARAAAAAWASSRSSSAAPPPQPLHPARSGSTHHDTVHDSATLDCRAPSLPVLDRTHAPSAQRPLGPRSCFSFPYACHLKPLRRATPSPSATASPTPNSLGPDHRATPRNATIPIARATTEPTRPAVSSPEACRTPAAPSPCQRPSRGRCPTTLNKLGHLALLVNRSAPPRKADFQIGWLEDT